MKEIELCGEDMNHQDADFISETIYNSLLESGIDVTSFAWSINVEYLPQENHDNYCNSILAGEMDSGDVEMLQEQLHKFSPPQEYDDE